MGNSINPRCGCILTEFLDQTSFDVRKVVTCFGSLTEDSNLVGPPSSRIVLCPITASKVMIEKQSAGLRNVAHTATMKIDGILDD